MSFHQPCKIITHKCAGLTRSSVLVHQSSLSIPKALLDYRTDHESTLRVSLKLCRQTSLDRDFFASRKRIVGEVEISVAGAMMSKSRTERRSETVSTYREKETARRFFDILTNSSTRSDFVSVSSASHLPPRCAPMASSMMIYSVCAGLSFVALQAKTFGTGISRIVEACGYSYSKPFACKHASGSSRSPWSQPPRPRCERAILSSAVERAQSPLSHHP